MVLLRPLIINHLFIAVSVLCIKSWDAVTINDQNFVMLTG